MPIEIKELLIKVKIQNDSVSQHDPEDFQLLKQSILKECKKEIEKQIKKKKER